MTQNLSQFGSQNPLQTATPQLESKLDPQMPPNGLETALQAFKTLEVGQGSQSLLQSLLGRLKSLPKSDQNQRFTDESATCSTAAREVHYKSHSKAQNRARL